MKKKIIMNCFIFICFFFIVFLYINFESNSKIDIKSYGWENDEYLELKKNIEKTVMAMQSKGERNSWIKQKKTSEYLQERFLKMKIIPEVFIYEYKKMIYDNIIITFSGKKKNNEIILLVAHYDSVSNTNNNIAPGADDNASGVAVLIELARILKKRENEITIKLALFSNEENGQIGSLNYARKIIDKKLKIKGVINVDMVGYYSPKAIYSKELTNIINSNFEIMQKAKMLTKLMYNSVYFFVANKKILKVMIRKEDKQLQPVKITMSNFMANNKIKWEIGDICV
jgi:hypothetical protein